MNKNFRQTAVCAAVTIGFAVIGNQANAMDVREDQIRLSYTRSIVLSSHTEMYRDLEMQSKFYIEIENTVLGIKKINGLLKGVPLYICLGTGCIVVGLSVLHLVGVF